MVSILSPKLERPVNMRRHKAAPIGTLIGIELALHRAEPYLLAGWQLTPEQVLRLFGGDSAERLPSPQRAGCRGCPEEDELLEIPFYFGDEH